MRGVTWEVSPGGEAKEGSPGGHVRVMAGKGVPEKVGKADPHHY